MKKIILIGLLLLSLLLAAFLLSRPRPSDEEQIFRVVDELKVAVEQKKSQDILTNIAEDYRDSSQLTRRDLQLMTNQLARSGGRLTITITDYSEPKIAGRNASLSLAVEIKYNEATSAEGNIIFSFVKEKGKWKVIKAEGWQNWAQQAGLGYEW